MKTILLLGEYLDELQDLHNSLATQYQVQLCSLQKENIMGMVKMVRPELAVICMLEGNNPDKDIFRWMNRYWPEIPILIVVTKGRWDKIKVLYDVGHYDKVFYPVEQEVLVQNCEILLENVDFGKEPNKATEPKNSEQDAPVDDADTTEEQQEEASEVSTEELLKAAEVKKPAERTEVSDKPEETAPQKTAKQEEKKKKKTVLLVDDSPLLLRSMKTILQDSYNVELATSGRMALNKINQVFPDIILLDYEMPEMDGSETYERILKRDNAKHIPVIFLTSVTDKSRIVTILKKKPAGYILKPPNRNKLIELIEEVLDKK